MKTNYDVAIRMENKKISDGVVLFKPTNAITGEYNSCESMFTSFDGEHYFTQDAFIGNFDTSEDYICSNILSASEFNKRYGNCASFKEALKKYKEDSSLYKLIYFDNEENTFKWIDFNIFDLLNTLAGISNDSPITIFEEKEVYNIDDNEYEEPLNNAVDKVNSLYNVHKKDREFVKKLYSALDSVTEDLVSIMYDISVDFPDVFDKKTNLSVRKSDEVKDESTEQGKYSPKKLDLNDKIEFYKERKRIIENIKKVIIGHDDEVEKIVVEIFRLIRQYGNKNKGILLTGSTGCGKSKICELIAENLGRPCKIVDTTQLSAPGYKGRDIESYLEELYDSVGGNKEKAENSVIVFDEVDKLGHSQRKDDVSGVQVLNRLLMFLNGTTYTIKERTRDANPQNISTKNMIVIFCGSFSSVYKSQKFNKREVGFNSTHESKVGKAKPTTDDFINLGGMPDEMMGRFPVTIHLEDLTKNNLKDILLKSTESPILFVKEEFIGEAGVELEFTDDAIDAIVEECYKLNTFARGLNKIVTDSVSKAFHVVTDNIGMYDKVIITKDTIYDNSKYVLHEVEEKDKNLIKM